MKQSKALGTSHAGLPFVLDVPVPGRDGLGTSRRKQKERVHLGFWLQLWKGTEARYTPQSHLMLIGSNIALSELQIAKIYIFLAM